jgi:hypothetical protein
MFTSIAMEWKQPLEYVLELPDMVPVWDIIDIHNPEDPKNPKTITASERRKRIDAFREAQSERLKKKEENKE